MGNPNWSRIHERTIFVEVSGHNLESSQTWGFCMDFLNNREGDMGFYQVFLLSPLQCTVTEVNSRNCKRLRAFEEIEISRQRLLSGFVQEYGLWIDMYDIYGNSQRSQKRDPMFCCRWYRLPLTAGKLMYIAHWIKISFKHRSVPFLTLEFPADF